jgi:soluble lytic murein transglycosylase-like protein
MALRWPPWLRLLRNAAAAIGLLALVLAVALVALPPVRGFFEAWLLDRMTQRAVSYAEAEGQDDAAADALRDAAIADPGGAQRAVALDPARLPADQARVAQWLASRYRIGVAPVAAIVAEAYRIGPKLGLQPTLLLAVAAVESNFNPYIQSDAGADGLMQIMSRIHIKRLEAEGGRQTAFDPIVNLRVGAKILQDCVKFIGGSTEDGLRFYLGGSRVDAEISNRYIQKVNDIKGPLDALVAQKAGR